MKIAVVGAGINGLMTARHLINLGNDIYIFERGEVCGETSSRSSKMLHGGIRYLENFKFKLVREALKCRKMWMDEYGDFIRKEQFIIPIYRDTKKSLILLYLGVKIYEILAGKASLGKSQYRSRSKTLEILKNIKKEGLTGSVSYYDAVMDDESLINKLRNEIEKKCTLLTNTEVSDIRDDGKLEANNKTYHFDLIINASGPWAGQFDINSEKLKHIRGSHLWIDRKIDNPIVKVNDDGRIIFFIPFCDKSLLGTTEVEHNIDKRIECDIKEQNYLINEINKILTEKIYESDVVGKYSGIRPIVKSNDEISNASRDSLILRKNKIITIYGGKWTSANVIGEKVMKKIDELWGGYA